MIRTPAALFFPLLLSSSAFAQAKPDDKKPADAKPDDKKEVEEPRGLKLHAPGAFDGLTIIQPLRSKDVHLVDMEGNVVHTWHTDFTPGAWLYLRDDGILIRSGQKDDKTRFHGGGIGGVIQEIAWDGKVVWEYELATDGMRMHHDIEVMPNGHILAIAWENHSAADAVAHGRDAEEVFEKEGLWPDAVLELKPIRPRGAEIVWSWRAWDHLVQDRDPKKPGYAALRDAPGRIDINADHRYEKKEETPEEAKKRAALAAEMKKLGYAGGDAADDAPKDAPPKDGTPKDAPPKDGPPKPPEPSGDFMHTNAVDYLPSEDLILLSSPHLCELFVIDHGTTTTEAAGSTGGKRGKGGELLWRWGNPQNYGCATREERHSFYQHDPSWLPQGKDGELRVLFFNNGQGRTPKEFSSVEELVLPFTHAAGFARAEGKPFGPALPAWSYADPDKFFSPFISGAQRLPNGDTLICEGKNGRVFEVTPDGRVVWDYLNPLGGEVEPSPQGGKAPPKALFRAVRIARDHPGLKGKLP